MTSIAASAWAGRRQASKAGDEAPRCHAVYGDFGCAEERRHSQAGEPVLLVGLIGACSAGGRMVVIEPTAARVVDVGVVVAGGGPANVRSSVVALALRAAAHDMSILMAAVVRSARMTNLYQGPGLQRVHFLCGPPRPLRSQPASSPRGGHADLVGPTLEFFWGPGFKFLVASAT
jgi:hypothetical protein